MNKSRFLKNVLFGFGGQSVIIILGIIVPRIMIMNYGSDINGLLSTVSQIFTYMALLEAGIAQASKNSLYEPISKNDRDGFCSVVSTTRSYFRKVTLIYAVGVFILSFIVPFILKSSVPKLTIFLVVLFEGLSGVTTFFFIQTNTVILAADGRGYVNNAVNVVNKTLSYIIRIVMAMLGINIVVLQFAYLCITVAKVFFYRWYFKKYYSWVVYSSPAKESKLPDRNSYILTEIAWTVFSSTDMIILSVFVSTQLASVYSVYNLIFVSLNVLLNAVYYSVNYTLGQTYHESLQKYETLHDAYNSIFLGVMTIFMSVAYVLCTPFVQLYTHDVTDVNYLYSHLPLLFCLVQIISWSRYIGGNLTGVAGYAKPTSRISVIEAILNLALSLALVSRYGIEGVVLATVIALPLKVIYVTYISDKKVMKRSYKNSLKITMANYGFFATVVVVFHFISVSIDSYSSFFGYGLFFTLIFSVAGVGINYIANPNCIKLVKRVLKKQ